MKKTVCLLVAFAIALSFLPPVFAGEESMSDYFSGIGTKFGRGLQNVLTSPLELPCVTSSEMRENPDWGLFSGLGKGTAMMLRRMLVGVTEVATFVIPMEATIPAVCRGQ